MHDQYTPVLILRSMLHLTRAALQVTATWWSLNHMTSIADLSHIMHWGCRNRTRSYSLPMARLARGLSTLNRLLSPCWFNVLLLIRNLSESLSGPYTTCFQVNVLQVSKTITKNLSTSRTPRQRAAITLQAAWTTKLYWLCLDACPVPHCRLFLMNNLQTTSEQSQL
jgi:hypothetical protein